MGSAALLPRPPGAPATAPPIVAGISGASGVPGRELDDPEAHDLVGDPQRAVEGLEQLRRGVELQQVVLGARLVVDRVSQRALAPLVVAQELALGLDRRARVGDDLRARRLLDLGGRAGSRDRMSARAGSWDSGKGSGSINRRVCHPCALGTSSWRKRSGANAAGPGSPHRGHARARSAVRQLAHPVFPVLARLPSYPARPACPFARMSASCSSIQSPGSREVTISTSPSARRRRSAPDIVSAA